MSQPQPRVVLVHGFLDAGEIWRPVLSILGNAAGGWLAPDLPGLGQAWEDPGPFTLTRFADTVAAGIKASDGPLILVGHSMGSQVVELVAQRVKNPVLGMLLLSPVPLAGTHLKGPMIDMLASTGGNAEAQSAARNALVAQPADAKTLEWLQSLGAKVRRDATEQMVAAWNNGVPDGQRNSKFEGPVLVASGENDQFVSKDMAMSVASRFKNSSLAWISQCGHWPPAERPGPVADLIKFFVANCSDKGSTREGSDGWTKAFGDKSETSFSDSFSESVVFEASVLAKRVEGIERVRTILGVASRLYSKLEFTRKTKDGDRTYMEWEATVIGGGAVSGITILTNDPAGKITSIAIHHRPLNGVIHFSKSLARDLAGKIEPDMFFQAP